MSQGVAKVRQEGFSLLCKTSGESLNAKFLSRYFRLEDNLGEITASLVKDSYLSEVIQKFYGLRLLAQDKWECLLSFVTATNSNIPSIRRKIDNLCRALGDDLIFDGSTFKTFPTAERLAEATVATIAGCGLGYRAPYVKRVAEAVCSGEIDLSELNVLDYEDAQELLLRELKGEKLLPGVGRKVADCVLLFSCKKDEAFPIDVWITKVIASHYADHLDPRIRKKVEASDVAVLKLSPREYDSISRSMRSYFGIYAGFAQQYLYMSAISGNESSGPVEPVRTARKVNKN